MSELFDTSTFSSKNEIRGSTDSAWDDGSAFPSCEVGRTETVTHREMRHGDNPRWALSPLRAVSDLKIWVIGDRIAAIGDDNQAQSLGTVVNAIDTPHRIGGWGFLSNPETDSQRRYQCTPTDSTQV